MNINCGLGFVGNRELTIQLLPAGPPLLITFFLVATSIATDHGSDVWTL
jgi:hypothetical protein